MTLGRNLTPATEPLPEGALVTRGIYRMVRHPIYLGVSTIMAGYGICGGEWWIGAAAFAVALAYFEAKARVEERFLGQRMHRVRGVQAAGAAHPAGRVALTAGQLLLPQELQRRLDVSAPHREAGPARVSKLRLHDAGAVCAHDAR